MIADHLIILIVLHILHAGAFSRHTPIFTIGDQPPKLKYPSKPSKTLKKTIKVLFAIKWSAIKCLAILMSVIIFFTIICRAPYTNVQTTVLVNSMFSKKFWSRYTHTFYPITYDYIILVHNVKIRDWNFLYQSTVYRNTVYQST